MSEIFTGLEPIDFPRDIDIVVEGLKQARLDWRQSHARHTEHGIHFPSRQALERITRELGAALFPLRLGPRELHTGNENAFVGASLESVLSQLGAQVALELQLREPDGDRAARSAERIVGAFAATLPAIRRLIDSDVEAGYQNDPAAISVDEVLLSYPSVLAVIHHRLAHRLHDLGVPIVARIIAEIAHGATGIDIHPGASIGQSFFIDHGSGVVIGETSIVGARVRLYQGVTLGGQPFANGAAYAESAGERRHPRVEDDVVIFAGATIIGPVTIGARSRVAGNIWLREDVPPDSLVEPAAPSFHALT
jgi:serine O-acetyltransferase